MQKPTQKNSWMLLGAVAFLGNALAGCHGSGDGMSDAQKETADKMQQISSKSNGDWDKLSQADRSEFIKAANGSEQSAKMLFMARSGKLRGNPNAAPGK